MSFDRNNRNKPSDRETVLWLVMIISICVVSYSVLTYGRTVIHADTAIASMLAKAELKYHQWFPDSWCYANGELWTFYCNIFTMPFLGLKDQSLARMLGSLSAILTSCLAIFTQSRKLFSDRSWLISIPIFLLCTFGVYDPADPYSGEYDMLLYQAAYVHFIIWIVIITWITYDALIKAGNDKRKVISLPALLFLAILSGIRFAAELTVPLFLTILFFYLAENKKDAERQGVKELIRNIAYIAVPSCLGYLVSRHINNSQDVFYIGDSKIGLSKDLAVYWDNFTKAVYNIFANFGYVSVQNIMSFKGLRNIISLVLCLFIVIIIPILQAKKIKNESDPVRFFFVFGIIHNLEMFMMAVVFGFTTYRYLLTSIYVFEIISAVYVYEHWLKKGKRTATAIVAVFVVFMFVYWGAMLENSVGWRDALEARKALSRELVSRGLTKGYAPYWDSYQHEIYSDGKLEMVSVANDMRQVPGDGPRDLIWQNRGLADVNKFIPEDKSTFLMVDNEMDPSVKERIPVVYGEPVDVFEYDDRTIYVWNYDIAGVMANGFSDGKLTRCDMWLTDNAMVDDDHVVLKKDSAVYGPFLSLGKGKYRFTIEGFDLEGTLIDIHSYEKPEAIVSTEAERQGDHVIIDADVNESVNDIEIRVVNVEDKDVVFKDIRIERR